MENNNINQDNATLLLSKMTELINNKNKFLCCAIYLLVSYDNSVDYDLYLLNVDDNDPFIDIAKKSVNFDETLEIYSYDTNITPDGDTIILHIDDSEIPDYSLLKSKVTNGFIDNLTNNCFNELESKKNIKGYIIKLTYIEGNEQKNVTMFANLNSTHVLSATQPFYSFFGDRNIFKKIDMPLIKFNENIVAINFEDSMFVLHRHYFENLFHYEELLNKRADQCVRSIQKLNLIANIDILNNKYINNKNIRRKLSTIMNNPSFDKMSFEGFSDLKSKYPNDLFFSIDEQHKKIFIDESNINTSINQILRILNDESALTIIGQRSIFAHEQIPLNKNI